MIFRIVVTIKMNGVYSTCIPLRCFATVARVSRELADAVNSLQVRLGRQERETFECRSATTRTMSSSHIITGHRYHSKSNIYIFFSISSKLATAQIPGSRHS